MSQSIPKAVRPLPMGHKQVFLPNLVLTLLRTPKLPPTFASFLVPLNLNKLDLRDYLYNGYNIRVNAVRSYIQVQKLRQDKPGARRPAPRKWFRPKSIKKMTVEMEQPFAWPEEPANFEKWDKATYDAAIKDRDASEEVHKPDYREKPTRERSSIAMQAQKALDQAKDKAMGALIIDGKAKKRVRQAVEKMEKAEDEGEGEDGNRWEDGAEEIEVEQDVELPIDDTTGARKTQTKGDRTRLARGAEIEAKQDVELPIIDENLDVKKRGTSRADRVAKAKEGEPWRLVEKSETAESGVAIEDVQDKTK